MMTASTLGCTQKRVVNRLGDEILPLSSALERPHLEYCPPVWLPQHEADVDILE